MSASTLRSVAATLALSDRTYHYSAAYASASESLDLAACAFLAAKTCEEPRRVRDVLNAIELTNCGDFVRDAQEYWKRKEQLVLGEQHLLRSLGYDTACVDAQILLLNTLHALRASHALYELCIALLNDAAGACATLTVRVTVAAIISIGAASLEVPLPALWLRILEVDGDPHALASACNAILDVYDEAAPAAERQASPTRLHGAGKVEG